MLTAGICLPRGYACTRLHPLHRAGICLPAEFLRIFYFSGYCQGSDILGSDADGVTEVVSRQWEHVFRPCKCVYRGIQLVRTRVLAVYARVSGFGALTNVYMDYSRYDHYTKKCFPRETLPTIFDSISVTIVVGSRPVSLNIWDTAGQDEVNRLRPLAYALTDVFLVVFAIDEPKTLDSVRKKWAPELQHHTENSLILLIGNKSDLRDSKEAENGFGPKGEEIVVRESAVAVAKEIGAWGYYECSALTTEGLKTVFDEAIQGVLKIRDSKGKGKRPRSSKSGPKNSSKNGCTIV
ncbi:hypothetical protein AAMO2058_000442200 [Amorphochlora amoebiformis]